MKPCLVDVVSKNTLADHGSLPKIDDVIQVVLHTEIRNVLTDHHTHDTDMINAWDEDDRVGMSCGHAISEL